LNTIIKSLKNQENLRKYDMHHNLLAEESSFTHGFYQRKPVPLLESP